MKKILIVDDAPDVLAWLEVLLKSAGWTVFKAADGQSACDVLEENDVRVVITDWMMPGMDGIELIERIRSQDRREYIYTILMTARGSEEDSVHGLGVGADDYMIKPASAAMLKARLNVAQRILDMQQEVMDEKDRCEATRVAVTNAYTSVKKELSQAAKQQLSSLPGGLTLPEGVETDWRFKPATDLSGDHLDFFLVGEERIAFYLLDISGHGVPAALRSAALSELLRPFTPMMGSLETIGPHRVLEQVNAHIWESNEEVEYLATLVLGFLNMRTGKLRLSSAGHPSPLVAGQSGKLEETLEPGLPLGVMPDTTYETRLAKLDPGETLLLFSDGVPDCRDPSENLLGMEAFYDHVRQAESTRPASLISSLEHALDEWRDGTALEDDTTLLAIGLAPASPGGLE